MINSLARLQFLFVPKATCLSRVIQNIVFAQLKIQMKNHFLETISLVFTLIGLQEYTSAYILQFNCSLLGVVSWCLFCLLCHSNDPPPWIPSPVFYSFGYIHSRSFYDKVVMWLDNGKSVWVSLAWCRQSYGKVCPKKEMGMCTSLFKCTGFSVLLLSIVRPYVNQSLLEGLWLGGR